MLAGVCNGLLLLVVVGALLLGKKGPNEHGTKSSFLWLRELQLAGVLLRLLAEPELAKPAQGRPWRWHCILSPQ